MSKTTINLSPNVEVWDQNADPVYYDDLDDLRSQLEQMLTLDCKIFPIIKYSNIGEPVIVKLRIKRVN